MAEQVRTSHAAKQPESFIRKYVFSRDHKTIGIQYFFLALLAALTGVAMSLLMRLRLAWPAARWPMLEAIFPGGFKDRRAADNPWEATTLEWTTRTPVPHDSFGYAQPVVTRML